MTLTTCETCLEMFITQFFIFLINFYFYIFVLILIFNIFYLDLFYF